jgi:TatD DNase family protein
MIDSHAHIDGHEYDNDRLEVIERAHAAGVKAVLNVGTGDPHSGTMERAVNLAEEHDHIYAAVGVHPHDAKLFNEETVKRLTGIVRGSSKVVAWGEIGLDYHYDHSLREVQQRVFIEQLKLAREANLPVIIHSRDADEDTIDILSKKWKGSSRDGVMHCFGGSLKMAEMAVEMGFYISFAGNVTFKNAHNLREVAQMVPLDRLLVETDCPYMAPVPVRGRRNEPSNVMHTANFLASLLGLSVEELDRITTENFNRLFNLRVGI